MRNKYSKEFEDYIYKNIGKYTKEQLIKKAKDLFGYDISKHQMECYLARRNLKHKGYCEGKVQNIGDDYKIGSEYTKDDGMTLIKISKNKWEYKQRWLYKKYHNCELSSDDFIIFLNQNRNDFSKNNLMKISRHESSILSNQKMFSSDKEVTKLGVTTAKLMIKLKEVKNEN